MSIVKRDSYSPATISGSAGKVMLGAGAGALGLGVLAAIIPFVGVIPLAIVFIVLGFLMWE